MGSLPSTIQHTEKLFIFHLLALLHLLFKYLHFIALSGFYEAELCGKNHNVVRHPDMPPAAFVDLWNMIKTGKPWMGIVKNHHKMVTIIG